MLANLLAYAQPQDVLPSPGVGALSALSGFGIAGGIEQRLNAELRGRIDDAFVLVLPFLGSHVNLIVVQRPTDEYADRVGCGGDEKSAHAVGERVHLGSV